MKKESKPFRVKQLYTSTRTKGYEKFIAVKAVIFFWTIASAKRMDIKPFPLTISKERERRRTKTMHIPRINPDAQYIMPEDYGQEATVMNSSANLLQNKSNNTSSESKAAETSADLDSSASLSSSAGTGGSRSTSRSSRSTGRSARRAHRRRSR